MNSVLKVLCREEVRLAGRSRGAGGVTRTKSLALSSSHCHCQLATAHSLIFTQTLLHHLLKKSQIQQTKQKQATAQAEHTQTDLRISRQFQQARKPQSYVN